MREESPGSSEAGIGGSDRDSLGGAENAELERHMEKLERSNADLEEFGRVIAHDLSEGLATVALFADALETRMGRDLDQATTRNLEGIRAGIERMQSLISATLRSARGPAGAEHHGPVDTNAVLRDALASIHARVEQTGAEVVAEPLPWVSGNGPELTRLFQNLLANSIEFRDPLRPVRIRVGARRDGRRWRFEVADNGIGLDPELAERAFNPSSQRAEIGAHPDGGLGLTICQRIVRAHGGQARAEPRPEGGTTVSFDLPAVEGAGAGPGRQPRLSSQGPEVRPKRSSSSNRRRSSRN